MPAGLKATDVTTSAFSSERVWLGTVGIDVTDGTAEGGSDMFEKIELSRVCDSVATERLQYLDAVDNNYSYPEPPCVMRLT